MKINLLERSSSLEPIQVKVLQKNLPTQKISSQLWGVMKFTLLLISIASFCLADVERTYILPEHLLINDEGIFLEENNTLIPIESVSYDDVLRAFYHDKQEPRLVTYPSCGQQTYDPLYHSGKINISIIMPPEFLQEICMAAGRPLNLPSNFKGHDFVQLAQQEKNARARVRYIGLDNLQKGKDIKEVSKILSVHKNTVKNWVKRFRKKGVEGLKEQLGRGAKRKVPKEYEQIFREAVLELQANRKGGG